MLEGKTEKAETINEVENKDKNRGDRGDRIDKPGDKIRKFFDRIFINKKNS